jgi:hypothetical protein
LKLKLIVFIAFIVTSLSAATSKFILNHDGLIDQRAQDKIVQIGLEVQKKLNSNIYIYIAENNGIDMEKSRDERIQKIREFDKKILKDLKGSYAVLVLAIDQIYANILLSKDLQDKIDKGDVLNGYVIPLLASKDKNTLFAKTSAASLNGYAQIADSLAAHHNIKLESSIGSEGKTASTLWRVFMYFLVVVGIVSYTVIVLREKKMKNG